LEIQARIIFSVGNLQLPVGFLSEICSSCQKNRNLVPSLLFNRRRRWRNLCLAEFGLLLSARREMTTELTGYGVNA